MKNFTVARYERIQRVLIAVKSHHPNIGAAASRKEINTRGVRIRNIPSGVNTIRNVDESGAKLLNLNFVILKQRILSINLATLITARNQ